MGKDKKQNIILKKVGEQLPYVGAIAGAATSIISHDFFVQRDNILGFTPNPIPAINLPSISEIIVPTLGGAVIGYEAKRTLRNISVHGFSAPINDYTDATVGIGTGLVSAIINPHVTMANSISLIGAGIMASKGVRHGIKCSPLVKTSVYKKNKKAGEAIINIKNKETKWEQTKMIVNSYLDKSSSNDYKFIEKERYFFLKQKFNKILDELLIIINKNNWSESEQIKKFIQLFVKNSDINKIIKINVVETEKILKCSFYLVREIIDKIDIKSDKFKVIGLLYDVWNETEKKLSEISHNNSLNL